jgi:uncharacterized protein (TIGR04255 family)
MPDYKNPSIEEAICEFTFATDAAAPEWDLTLPGRLQVEAPIKQDYPGPSRQQLRGRVEATSPAGQPSVSLMNELFRVQLLSADQKAILSIGKDALSVSVLRPYEGWKQFKPRIERALATYVKVATQPAVVRIGLRYVNRLIVPTPDAASASRYLRTVQTSIEATSLADGSKIEGALTALNTRHEFVTPKPDELKIYITVATLQPATPNTAEYLLDIDTVRDLDPTVDLVQIVRQVDKSHVVVGSLFERLITDETRAILEPN